AGTGVGKTLGYLAPATVWAGKNKGSVWISTYTRALQRQIDQETDRLFDEIGSKNRNIVVRKGRENYLCLLNLQEAGQAGGLSDRDRIGLVLTARWAERSRSGDMVGGDFPAWLIDLFGGKVTTDLTDQRGECLYSGCPHYGKCGIEKNIRNARNARLVIANHALVLNQAGQGPESDLSEHVVFDEGHHLFDASDSFFSAGLSGMETAELRRWLLGPESDRRGRGRGLRNRMEEVVTLDPRLPDLLKAVEQGAYALPGPGWYQRLRDGTPDGAGEYFLSFVGEQVYARADKPGDPFSIECTPRPPVPGLLAAAREFGEALGGLLKPVQDLRACLIDVLEQPTEKDDEALSEEDEDRPVQWKSQADARRRAEAMIRSLERRAIDPLTAWSSMLRDLETEPQPDFVDWFSVERVDGRDRDLGYYRHFVDPMKPFSQVMAGQVQGFVVTSATLTDPVADTETAWRVAEERSGAQHLRNGAFRARVASPYDYANQAEVLIVGDVPKNQPGALAAAFESLFKASGGGGIGLFTAIRRLRGVYDRIRTPLEESGLPLFAQHVDAMDTGTLVDIFRDEMDACLLGTDAVRDGVDVPGQSLRLLAFERVPWPRPDILHRARRDAFGGRGLDDMLARAKLRQAFGRLIRRQTDKGVFVLLDPMMPSRLESAFPTGVPIHRLGLDEACQRIKDFL
ncbi:MAG: ATP-dependent DNA helicase, partial [Alphaproteobacteria bacterium]